MKDKGKGQASKSLVGGYAAGYGLAIKFIFVLSCPLAAGFACGIWVDSVFNTTPILTLIFVVLGLAFSIYAVYRVAVQLQEGTRE